jgi:hypothetical protein
VTAILTAVSGFAVVLTSTTPIVVRSARGFDWTASAVGAAAGFGLALALVGSIALLRGRPTGHDQQEGGNR